MIEQTLENALSFVSDSRSCSAVMTAADEILSNIDKYASLENSDEISVLIDVNIESGFVMLKFEYGGVLFDPVRYYKSKNFSENRSDPGGRGILLAFRIMDEFSYRENNGKNIVEIIKFLNINAEKNSDH